MNKIKWSKKQNPNSWDMNDVKKVTICCDDLKTLISISPWHTERVLARGVCPFCEAKIEPVERV